MQTAAATRTGTGHRPDTSLRTSTAATAARTGGRPLAATTSRPTASLGSKIWHAGLSGQNPAAVRADVPARPVEQADIEPLAGFDGERHRRHPHLAQGRPAGRPASATFRAAGASSLCSSTLSALRRNFSST